MPVIAPRQVAAIFIAALSTTFGASCSSDNRLLPSDQPTTLPSTPTTVGTVPQPDVSPPPTAGGNLKDIEAQATVICDDIAGTLRVGESATYFAITQEGTGSLKMSVGPNLVEVTNTAPQQLKGLVGNSPHGTWVELSQDTPTFTATYKREDGSNVRFLINIQDRIRVTTIDMETYSQSSSVEAFAHGIGDQATAGVAYAAGLSPNTHVQVRHSGFDAVAIDAPIDPHAVIPGFYNNGGMRVESIPLREDGTVSISADEAYDGCVAAAHVRSPDVPKGDLIPPVNDDGQFISF